MGGDPPIPLRRSGIREKPPRDSNKKEKKKKSIIRRVNFLTVFPLDI
jgi:hypothetical protein